MVDERVVPARWGVPPRLLLAVVRQLEWTITFENESLAMVDWPEEPDDLTRTLARELEHTQAIVTAARDLRSLLTAYAHRFHQPRPVMAALARAQGASPQGVASRYSASTVALVERLVVLDNLIQVSTASEAALTRAVSEFKAELVRAFPSLTPQQARSVIREIEELDPYVWAGERE